MKRYVAELHAHSTCSDGWLRPEEIPGLAKKKGLDIVAVTDHASIEGGIRAKEAMKESDAFVIPGMEITLPGGHILAYFLRDEIKPGVIHEVIKNIREQDGIAVLAHPVHYPVLGRIRGKGVTIPKPEDLSLFDAVEIFNSRNSKKANQKILELCKSNDVRLMTAGSDAHFPFEFGLARTVFELAQLNEQSIKEAFKEGHFHVVENLKGSRMCYFITGILNRFRAKEY